MPLEYALQYNRPKPNPWKEPVSEKLKISAPIGIPTLPEQYTKHIHRKGFSLNIMILGQGGLGKTTFLNTLFEKELLEKPELDVEERKKTKILSHSFDLIEGNVKLKVNIFESVELGVHLKKEEGIEPIVEFIESRLLEHFEHNEAPQRDLAKPDPRIHICLYFLPPGGHPISELDLALISRIHDKVNLVPVISKADSFTPEECKKFKTLVLKTMKEYDIRLYPQSVGEKTTAIENYPFSIIGSEGTFKVNGKSVRGRKFRWGVAEVDNPEHCDFGLLKKILINENFDDLHEKTELLYEEFRREQLTKKGVKDSIMESDDDFQENLKKQREQWLQKARKEEEELEKKWKAKMEELEEDYKKKHKALEEKKAKTNEELQEKKNALKREEEEFENQLEALDEVGEEGEEKSDKKKKRMSLAGVTKSIRRK